jgi:glycosyltransferase involved in cell wall biosynthesis
MDLATWLPIYLYDHCLKSTPYMWYISFLNYSLVFLINLKIFLKIFSPLFSLICNFFFNFLKKTVFIDLITHGFLYSYIDHMVNPLIFNHHLLVFTMSSLSQFYSNNGNKRLTSFSFVLLLSFFSGIVNLTTAAHSFSIELSSVKFKRR